MMERPATVATMHALDRISTWCDRRPLIAWALLALVVIAPAVVALVAVGTEQWFPTGDMAQAELHVRGIWSHPPLVGAAGRIESDGGVQGSHPGPSLWFAMYPVYLLFGRSSLGLLASVVSVHLVAAWLTLVLASRRGGKLLAAGVATGLTIVVASGGVHFAVAPWNPWLAVIPFAGFALACWLAVVDRSWFLALAVVLGSHCVQCHVGYAVIVVGLGAVTTAAVIWRGTDRIRALVLAVGAGVAMWALPLVDQFLRTPGNLSILVQHFVGPREEYLPLGTSLRVIGSELSVVGPWSTGPMLLERNLWGALVTMGVWVLAISVAVRRRDRDALVLHAVLGVAVVLGSLSVVRIFGGFQEYTIRWFWVLTAMILATTVWTLARERGRQAIAVLMVVTGLVAVVGSVRNVRDAELPGQDDSRLVAALADDVSTALDDPDDRYLVRWWDPVGLGATGFGLVLEMERRGHDMAVDPVSAAAALPHRVATEDAVDAVVYVVLGPQIDVVRAAGYTEVAYADLRTQAERERFDELDAELTARLTEIGRADLAERLDAPSGSAALLFINPPLPPDIAAMVSEYVSLRLDAAVFVLPPFSDVATGG